MQTKDGIMDDLREAINHWLESRKNRSLTMLANRTNRAYSTIRYIAQGERLPNESTILAITDIVMTTQQRVKFFKRYFPQIGDMMEKAYAPDIREEEHHEMLRRFINREPHNRIFNMAATSRGTTRTAVRKLLGQLGDEALQEMIDEGFLLAEDDDVVRYSSRSWAVNNIDDILTLLRSSLQHFDRDLIGTDGAALVHMTASVRPEEIPRIKELVSRFAQELSQLKNRPEAEGNVPFFCNLAYSVYDKNQWLSEDHQKGPNV
ncbi:MAG: hypothetical protein ACOH5I_09870 [Oligoflexus sp.]